MSSPHPDEPDALLRAHAGPQERVRLHVRNFSLDAMGRTSWAETAEHPSALDYLLAALATDLLAGVAHESRRGGPVIHDAELRLQAWLEHPLVVAGVVGELGSARVREVRGSLYLSTDAVPAETDALWARVHARAPVLASLAPGVAIHVQIQVVS